jgi:hypothetical protein
MADESGWSSVFKDLVQNFVLLRDVFGYVLPGATFLLLASFQRADVLKTWLDLYHPPNWVTAVCFLLASYVLGNVFAAVYYLPTDCWRLYKGPEATKNYTQVDADTLFFHRVSSDLFVELDRRKTTALLRAGLAVACVFSAIALFASPAIVRWELGTALLPLWFGGVVIMWLERRGHASPQRSRESALAMIFLCLGVALGAALYLELGSWPCLSLYASGAILWAGDVMAWPTLEAVRRESLLAAKRARDADAQHDPDFQ